MQKWLLQLYLISDRTVWPVLDKGWTWNVIDIKCVMLLINISGMFYYLLKKVNSSEIFNTTHLKKAKKGRRNPGYELGGWEPKNDLNWNNMDRYIM